MRSNKRYSNVTFTKRVDHLESQRNPDSPSLCKACGAIYTNHRWTLKKTTLKKAKNPEWHPMQYTTCPACWQEQEGIASGFVYLDGAFFVEHREEIERLLHNEADRAAVNNPLARIMNWKSEGDEKLTLTTTTEHLAQRLGHALEKAFSGSVEYDFSHENKLARVRWHRD